MLAAGSVDGCRGVVGQLCDLSDGDGRCAAFWRSTKVTADFNLLAAAVNLARLGVLGRKHQLGGWALSSERTLTPVAFPGSQRAPVGSLTRSGSSRTAGGRVSGRLRRRENQGER